MPATATPTSAKRAPSSPTASPRRRYCSVDDAAEFYGINARTVRKWLTEGRLTAYRVGNHLLRLDWSEVEALAVRLDPSQVSA